MFKRILTIIILLTLPCMAFSANTVTTNEKASTIQLTDLDSAWDSTASGYASGVELRYILFIPGAAGEYIYFYDESATTGPILSYMKSLDGEPRIHYFDKKKCKPVFDYVNSVVSVNTSIIIAY